MWLNDLDLTRLFPVSGVSRSTLPLPLCTGVITGLAPPVKYASPPFLSGLSSDLAVVSTRSSDLAGVTVMTGGDQVVKVRSRSETEMFRLKVESFPMLTSGRLWLVNYMMLFSMLIKCLNSLPRYVFSPNSVRSTVI